MLIPDTPHAMTPVVDIRDLSAWLLRASLVGTVGTYNAVGPSLPIGQWIELPRTRANMKAQSS